MIWPAPLESDMGGKKVHDTEGDIVLGFGQHELLIECPTQPVQVLLSIHDPCDGIPVCQASGTNEIAFQILNNGFILTADIKTSSACVHWQCNF